MLAVQTGRPDRGYVTSFDTSYQLARKDEWKARMRIGQMKRLYHRPCQLVGMCCSESTTKRYELSLAKCLKRATNQCMTRTVDEISDSQTDSNLRVNII